jgi:hypothetical protein
MTSIRQIEANRRNALKSTGPITDEGKRRSRRNALRHGLSAETVVEVVEDIDDFKGFEAAVIADYNASTAVERELVLRLASLFWRLRRTTAIETDLLRIQAEILSERSCRWSSPNVASPSREDAPYPTQDNANAEENTNIQWQVANPSDHDPRPLRPANSSRGLTHCFLRLANLENSVFDRLGRYEAGLLRQVLQTIYLLQMAKKNGGEGYPERGPRYAYARP